MSAERALSEAEFRRDALPGLLVAGTGLLGAGSLGTGWMSLPGERALALVLAGGALGMGVAGVALRRGRDQAVARIALAAWLAASVAGGLLGGGLAIGPASLALGVGLALCLDPAAVLGWSITAAAAWAAAIGLRSVAGPTSDDAALVAVGPAALLAGLGFAGRAVVRQRDEALAEARRASTHRLELEQRALAEALAAQTQAATANQTRSRFLANMSHELRTPLNAIIGYAELVREEIDEPEIAADVLRIERAGRHLLQLVNDVLDLSKIEAGQMVLHPVEFDLVDLVDEVCRTLRPAVESSGNALRTTLELGRSARFRADDARLKQILLNLLGNALKFTSGGEVELTLTRDGGGLRCSVRDTGIGMTEDQLGRLFQPFVQADPSTTRRFGGTGLGLSITRSLVEQMGGRIEVRSAPGAGSTFAFTLPPPPEHAPTPAPVPRGREDAPLVLVVDDEADARALMVRTLTAEGYRTLEAAEGRSALALAREHRPDAITLDILMPGLDGWGVLRELRADPELSRIPVVLVTFLLERRTGFALGASSYLTKPVDRDQLRRALRGAGIAGRSVLVVEDDEATRDVLARGLSADGWRVRLAADGIEGLERVQEERPSLVLLDLWMPRLDGFGFLRELRSRPEYADLPVTVLTAHTLTEEERLWLEGAAQRVLSKDGERGAWFADAVAEVGRAVAKGRPGGRGQSG
jgi:signal transduction histidine kinase/DNA-binding response OmpR family regulator